jgi:hypothetical protein
MPPPTFSPGFRLSRLDLIVLVLGGAGSVLLATMTWWWGFVLAFVLVHFFLFCNVFRLARALELAWSAVFLALAVATIAANAPGWLITALTSLVMTGIVVALEMRKASYHGVGWQRLNPGLPEWWESKRGDG